MNVTEWFQSQMADFYNIGIQKLVPRYDKCLNSGGEYLKNSSTLAVGLSVPINLSIKLGFISVNSPGETFFVDGPHRFNCQKI